MVDASHFGLYQVRAHRPKMILITLPSLYLGPATMVPPAKLPTRGCFAIPTRRFTVASTTPAQTETVNGNGVVQSADLVDKFHAYMLDRARNTDNSTRSDEIKAQQAARIFSATTEDAIWDADTGGGIQCRDVPGLMVEIRGFDTVISNRADIENSKGYYITMDATVIGGPDDVLLRNGLKVGETIPLQTGADLLMFKVRAMEAGGFLPMRTVIVATKTQSGNDVLRFGRMPRMAQTA